MVDRWEITDSGGWQHAAEKHRKGRWVRFEDYEKLEAALDWAVQWVPNPTECSPVPSTEIVKIIHNAVIRPDSQADGDANGG